MTSGLELPVIWTAILADNMCRKKSAVIRFITRSMKEAEYQIKNDGAQRVFTTPDTNITDQQAAVPQNLSEFDFSMSNLKERMTSGSRQACMIAKDLHMVYRALDSKHLGSDPEPSHLEEILKQREAFFELQTGYSPWSDVTGTVYEDARFNLSGFIQPRHASALLGNSTDSPGFLESTLAIICPKPRKVYHNQSIDASSCVLAPIFVNLRQHHTTTKIYLLDAQANAAFSSFYNDVEERLERMSNEDTALRRILAKSQGQVARLALVLHCLECITKSMFQKEEDVIFEPLEVIPLRIPAGVMYNAINLIQLCIRHKRALISTFSHAAATTHEKIVQAQGQTSLARDPRLNQKQQQQQQKKQQHQQKQEHQQLPQQHELQVHMQHQQEQLQHHLQQHHQVHRIGDVARSSDPATPRPDNISPSALQQRKTHGSGSGNQPQRPLQIHSIQSGHEPPMATSMSSTMVPAQSMPVPIGVSVVPDGPHIVQVTYTPEGSNVPISAHSQQGRNPELIPLNSISGRPAIKPKPNAQTVQRMSRFDVPPRPKSSTAFSGKMPPRPSSKLSAEAMKILRRAQKRNAPPVAPVPTGCPTSADFRNFMVQCPQKARRILTHGLNKIDAIYVAQRKLFPPVICLGPNGKKLSKYPANAARAFLTALADAGLGDMISRARSRSGKSTLKKKSYNELSVSALAILAKLNISEQQYTFLDNALY
nr:uncharacterized protein LOC129281697 [Lytechinus pictus]